MLQISTNDRPMSIDAACSILTGWNKLMPVHIDYDRLLAYYYYYNLKAYEAAKNLMHFCGGKLDITGKFSNVYVMNTIEKLGMTSMMPMTRTGSVSFNSKELSVLKDSPLLNDDQRTLVNLLITYSTPSYMSSAFKSLFDYGELSDTPSYEGHRMLSYMPLWVAQNTGRFTSTQPAFGNIARECQDLITCPRGYVLMNCDSHQIEPKINYSTLVNDDQIKYFIKLYGDAYYGLWAYCNQTDEQLYSGYRPEKAIDITPEMKAIRQEFKTIGNAVIYGSANTKGGNRTIENYIKRIGNHPMRVKAVAQIDRQLQNGDYIFYSKFGTPVDVTQSTNSVTKKSKMSNKSYINHLERSAINVLAQATAADLMRFAIAAADEWLTKNTTDSYINLSVHDALKYVVSEKEAEMCKEVLPEFVSYQVDDWLPIDAEVEIGPHRTNPAFEGQPI